VPVHKLKSDPALASDVAAVNMVTVRELLLAGQGPIAAIVYLNTYAPIEILSANAFSPEVDVMVGIAAAAGFEILVQVPVVPGFPASEILGTSQ
jgi:hypothetical protein